MRAVNDFTPDLTHYLFPVLGWYLYLTDVDKVFFFFIKTDNSVLHNRENSIMLEALAIQKKKSNCITSRCDYEGIWWNKAAYDGSIYEN